MDCPDLNSNFEPLMVIVGMASATGSGPPEGWRIVREAAGQLCTMNAEAARPGGLPSGLAASALCWFLPDDLPRIEKDDRRGHVGACEPEAFRDGQDVCVELRAI